MALRLNLGAQAARRAQSGSKLTRYHTQPATDKSEAKSQLQNSSTLYFTDEKAKWLTHHQALCRTHNNLKDLIKSADLDALNKAFQEHAAAIEAADQFVQGTKFDGWRTRITQEQTFLTDTQKNLEKAGLIVVENINSPKA